MGHFDLTSTNVATGASVNQSIETGTAVTASTNRRVRQVDGPGEWQSNHHRPSLSAMPDQHQHHQGLFRSHTALSSTAGVTVSDDGGKLKFTGTANQSIEVQVAGDIHNSLGLGSFSAQSNSVLTGGFVSATGGSAATHHRRYRWRRWRFSTKTLNISSNLTNGATATDIINDITAKRLSRPHRPEQCGHHPD